MAKRDADDPEDRESNERFSRWAIGAMSFFAAWGLFAAIHIFRSKQSPAESMGLFGDSFGVVNAAFSSIAAAGAVYAVILQRRELKLARIEARQSRREMARSAKAQDELVKLQARVFLAESLRKLISDNAELLTPISSEITDLAEYARKYPASYDPQKFRSLSKKESILKEERESMQERLDEHIVAIDSLLHVIESSSGMDDDDDNEEDV
jgi:hypothetical protein